MDMCSGIGVSVMYQAMTRPGSKNKGPPYSQAQLPGGSWWWEKKLSALAADASGVVAEGRSGKS